MVHAKESANEPCEVLLIGGPSTRLQECRLSLAASLARSALSADSASSGADDFIRAAVRAEDAHVGGAEGGFFKHVGQEQAAFEAKGGQVQGGELVAGDAFHVLVLFRSQRFGQQHRITRRMQRVECGQHQAGVGPPAMNDHHRR